MKTFFSIIAAVALLAFACTGELHSDSAATYFISHEILDHRVEIIIGHLVTRGKTPVCDSESVSVILVSKTVYQEQ